MKGFLKSIAELMVYKEPANEEHGFELLEDENERDQTDEPGKDKKQNGNNVKPVGNTKSIKLRAENRNSSGHGGNEVKKTIDAKTGGNKAESRVQPDDTDDIAKEIKANIDILSKKFHIPVNQDIVIREFKIGRKIKAFMAYMQGMVDKYQIDLAILPKLMSKDVLEDMGPENPVDYLIDNILSVNSIKKTEKFSFVITQILSGCSAIFVDGSAECVVIETKGYEKRSVDQPLTEAVVKGAQEGFTENLRTNVTLIRKIIKNENLVTEMLTVGNTNHANCAIMYLDGIVNPKVVKEVKKRINRINTDMILGDGMLEQFIEDNSFSLFPQVLDTERPDRSASFIMEGQVVIITEGTPFALAVPVTFFRLFHTSEDSFVRWPASNFLRLIRLFGLFCATFLPGIYVALTLYHVEMVPTELLISIARAKEMVPFPTILEVLIMEIAFELIREGGIRVPNVIGQTLGIVGALILGQAAVAAGLVSPLLVIVVSITGLGAFAIPNYSLSLAIRIERFLFIIAGAVLGFYGIALMAVLLAYFVCSMKSFGVPFMAPVAPKTSANPDVMLRYPIWMQKNRPDAINNPNRRRQGDNIKLWSSVKSKDRKNGGSNN